MVDADLRPCDKQRALAQMPSQVKKSRKMPVVIW